MRAVREQINDRMNESSRNENNNVDYILQRDAVSINALNCREIFAAFDSADIGANIQYESFNQQHDIKQICVLLCFAY